ncbi:MAG TPA: hypothetical protein PLD05_05275 [Thermogutta sp.]|nr:hypothetical protein [Thermogutta sp.]
MARQKSSPKRTTQKMTPASRTQQVIRLSELLSKAYRKRPADVERPVLEQLLFAALLENAHYEAALRVFNALKEEFFDWNEVRVSTVRDLVDIATGLPDPTAAAHRIKQPLQDIFESTYSFDLDDLKKVPIGQAVERLQKIDGVTRFMIGYVVQNALGGHTIPLDAATLQVLNILGLADESEVASGVVGGLERAIPKSQGRDFAWALHEFAAEFWADHHSPQVTKIMKAFDPQSLQRLEAWEAQATRQAEPSREAVAESTAVAEVAAATTTGQAEGQTGRGRRKKGEAETPVEPVVTSQQAVQPAAKEQEAATVSVPPGEKGRRGRPPASGEAASERKSRRGRSPKGVSDSEKKRGRKKAT